MKATPEELETQINAALESLPEKCREVFEMSRFREMKYREIADELDISQKNGRGTYVESNPDIKGSPGQILDIHTRHELFSR